MFFQEKKKETDEKRVIRIIASGSIASLLPVR